MLDTIAGHVGVITATIRASNAYWPQEEMSSLMESSHPELVECGNQKKCPINRF